MHVLFFLACGSSCQRLLRDRAKHQVDLRSNHSNTFSTIEGHHHVVSLPMQRTDERKQDESEALRCNRAQVFAGKGKHTAKGEREPISMPVSAYRFYNALSRFDFIVRL